MVGVLCCHLAVMIHAHWLDTEGGEGKGGEGMERRGKVSGVEGVEER